MSEASGHASPALHRKGLKVVKSVSRKLFGGRGRTARTHDSVKFTHLSSITCCSGLNWMSWPITVENIIKARAIPRKVTFILPLLDKQVSKRTCSNGAKALEFNCKPPYITVLLHGQAAQSPVKFPTLSLSQVVHGA